MQPDYMLYSPWDKRDEEEHKRELAEEKLTDEIELELFTKGTWCNYNEDAPEKVDLLDVISEIANGHVYDQDREKLAFFIAEVAFSDEYYPGRSILAKRVSQVAEHTANYEVNKS